MSSEEPHRESVAFGLALLLLTGVGAVSYRSAVSDVSREAAVPLSLAGTALAVGLLSSSFLALRRALAAARRRSREVARLAEVASALHACSCAEEVGRVLEEAARGLVPGEAGALYLPSSRAGGVFEKVAEWPAGEGLAPAFEGTECWALRTGRPTGTGGARGGLRCAHADGEGETLCLPMVAAGEVVGLFHLRPSEAGPRGRGRPGGDDEERGAAPVAAAVAALAATLALAVSNVRLRERLRSESIRDPLTGLSNRRHLEEAFDREVARSARSGSPIGIVMADLDHFKAVNDGEGHPAGDAVLREVGALLATSTRAGDLACRWGGEEFLLLLPSSGPEATGRRAEEIRRAVASTAVPFGGRLLGPFSASFGVASYPGDGATREAVVAAADAALYRAKEEGRNRVVAAPVRPGGARGGRT